jgi:putative ABC transport system permease protein
VSQGVRVTAVASLCGLAISLASGRLLAGMLFGVTPADPVTLGGVVVVVIGVAALASVIPAARAALIQPMRILRDE